MDVYYTLAGIAIIRARRNARSIRHMEWIWPGLCEDDHESSAPEVEMHRSNLDGYLSDF